MPISTADLAAATANDAQRDTRYLSWKVAGIIRVLYATDQIRRCEHCEGQGFLRPATLVACEECKGCGFVDNF
jgi:hypothetical protein